MHIKHFLFLCAVSVSFFTYSVDAFAEVIAGQVISFEVSRDGLQEKMEQLAAKPGVDPESKAREMNWYQLSDENIGDEQWFTFLSNSYQEILKTVPEQLKIKIQTLKIRETER